MKAVLVKQMDIFCWEMPLTLPFFKRGCQGTTHKCQYLKIRVYTVSELFINSTKPPNNNLQIDQVSDNF